MAQLLLLNSNRYVDDSKVNKKIKLVEVQKYKVYNPTTPYYLQYIPARCL